MILRRTNQTLYVDCTFRTKMSASIFYIYIYLVLLLVFCQFVLRVPRQLLQFYTVTLWLIFGAEFYVFTRQHFYRIRFKPSRYCCQRNLYKGSPKLFTTWSPQTVSKSKSQFCVDWDVYPNCYHMCRIYVFVTTELNMLVRGLL